MTALSVDRNSGVPRKDCALQRMPSQCLAFEAKESVSVCDFSELKYVFQAFDKLVIFVTVRGEGRGCYLPVRRRRDLTAERQTGFSIVSEIICKDQE